MLTQELSVLFKAADLQIRQKKIRKLAKAAVLKWP
uniref:Uncharacterized protein n=1 Tax=Anguilla anguilla TaxID=7936 RepID=A0A0E9PII5_ANGAN